jgi:glycerol-3-phosphate acyltransferase PlsY
MSDKALLIVCGYLIGAFILGVLVGRLIRWGRTGTTEYTDEDCDGC